MRNNPTIQKLLFWYENEMWQVEPGDPRYIPRLRAFLCVTGHEDLIHWTHDGVFDEHIEDEKPIVYTRPIVEGLQIRGVI